MIPALLASVGLPLVIRLAGRALGRIDNPVAQTAANALDQAGEAMTRREITPEQVRDANRHLERMAEIESEEFRTAMREVNRTMRTELRSDDAYVRRWRPTFGYAVAVTWVVQVGGLVYAIVEFPEHAGEIIAAMNSLSVIWGIALSVLGVNVAKRSQDKRLEAGEPAEPGVVTALVQRLLGERAGSGPET